MFPKVVGLEPTTLILKTKVLPIKLYLPLDNFMIILGLFNKFISLLTIILIMIPTLTHLTLFTKH